MSTNMRQDRRGSDRSASISPPPRPPLLSRDSPAGSNRSPPLPPRPTGASASANAEPLPPSRSSATATRQREREREQQEQERQDAPRSSRRYARDDSSDYSRDDSRGRSRDSTRDHSRDYSRDDSRESREPKASFTTRVCRQLGIAPSSSPKRDLLLRCLMLLLIRRHPLTATVVWYLQHKLAKMVTGMVERALRPLTEKPKGRRNLVVFWVVFNALLSVWLLHEIRRVRVSAAAASTATLPNVQLHDGNSVGASFSSHTSDAHSGTAGLIGIEDASHYATNSAPAQDKGDTTITATNITMAIDAITNHTAFAGTLGAKVAVVIETKATPNLIPVMMHFAAVLGPGWQVVLFTMEASWVAPASAAFGRLAASGQVAVRFLPPDTDFSTHASVSAWLVRPWLWEQLLGARRALLFQTDSIVCANAALRVDDFLEWDLVGAPIDRAHGHGYNGGLSLRNPAMMLRVARNASLDFAADATSADNRLKFEDQWFYTRLSELPDARLPGRDVAMTFAVETIYYDRPVGYHQPVRWQKDRMKEIEEWCPEVKMLIGPRY